MPQRRAHYAYAVVDTCVKPSLLNPRKYAARVMSEPEAIGFGSSRERFHESHYYLEDGDPGGNRMFAPHVGRSERHCRAVPAAELHTTSPTSANSIIHRGSQLRTSDQAAMPVDLQGRVGFSRVLKVEPSLAPFLPQAPSGRRSCRATRSRTASLSTSQL